LVIAFQVAERQRVPHVVLQSEVLELLELLVGFLIEIVVNVPLQLCRQLLLVQELLNLLVLKHPPLIRLVLFGRAIVPQHHIGVVRSCEGRHLGGSHLFVRVDRTLKKGKLIVVHLDGKEIVLENLFVEHGSKVEFLLCEQMCETFGEGSIGLEYQEAEEHVLFQEIVVKVHFHFEVHDFLEDGHRGYVVFNEQLAKVLFFLLQF